MSVILFLVLILACLVNFSLHLTMSQSAHFRCVRPCWIHMNLRHLITLQQWDILSEFLKTPNEIALPKFIQNAKFFVNHDELVKYCNMACRSSRSRYVQAITHLSSISDNKATPNKLKHLSYLLNKSSNNYVYLVCFPWFNVKMRTVVACQIEYPEQQIAKSCSFIPYFCVVKRCFQGLQVFVFRYETREPSNKRKYGNKRPRFLSLN